MAIDINISNYEEYLYSYVDGELNATEKVAFECFMEQHPQVRQELSLLEGTKLPADPAVGFENKASLYRGGDALNAQQYESYLLSYIDGELSATEREKLEGLVRTHAHIARELEILQVTKLQPDTSILFKDKQLLYRHTSRSRRIHPAWWAAAAAALVAGWLLWMPVKQDIVPVADGPIAKVQPMGPASSKGVSSGTSTAPATPPAISDNTAIESTNTAEPAIAATGTRQMSAAKRNAATAKENTALAASASVPESQEAPAEAVAALKLPQPRNTTEEVVQAHIDKSVNVGSVSGIAVQASADQKGALLANSAPLAAEKAIATPPPPPPPGELIMSVSSSGESKLMDKVTNVARFFGRKRNK
ncbi:hypothetical protein KTO58_22935 [Chitinophaga pendula]|uniref:hypothetical protein n=1 Tax=Chitinophaga TaxID=79328 RepID=UPI000BAEBF06|nr:MULTISPECIES: hypothetical protein [Chitinophaga]ASZ10530.1 hypothetical protein CK934_05840 [Chitinophaga sp. MD30]UCJ06497.1 hypothetical protein KTO58_22935 [Chitinophaga pendula]